MPRLLFLLLATFGLLTQVGCDSSRGKPVTRDRMPMASDSEPQEDPPEVVLGEKLFHDTRFSQYFYKHFSGQVNAALVTGDSALDHLETPIGSIPGPYRGQSISCASCHLVDQSKDSPGGGSRAYNDFARRSRIPEREDGLRTTVRNSPNLVGTSIRLDYFLHGDGEFSSPDELVRAGFIGRNFGWLAEEAELAIRHIARIIRQDDGSFPTDVDLNVSYSKLLLGTSSELSLAQIIPPGYRIDVSRASDQDILQAMAKLVGAYMESLDFSRDEQGNYDGSPYDQFLRLNDLPLSPAPNESKLDYSQRLLSQVRSISQIKFVHPSNRSFALHTQRFEFTELELEGFQIFMGRGRCVRCHAAPDFTDHLFHNTGTTQNEYDQIHGEGAFGRLYIPDLKVRSRFLERYLPSSINIPNATSVFRSIPDRNNYLKSDLGVWNVWQNPDLPLPQVALRSAICRSLTLKCTTQWPSDGKLLELSIALFKTPTLRDLGHSDPYMHTGQFESIESVVEFYVSIAPKSTRTRNLDPKLFAVDLTSTDVRPLSAFLRSLNEDYD